MKIRKLEMRDKVIRYMNKTGITNLEFAKRSGLTKFKVGSLIASVIASESTLNSLDAFFKENDLKSGND